MLIVKYNKDHKMHTKTPKTKPFLTFDQKKKNMLKSDILDLIPEKKRFILVIDPFRVASIYQ